MRRFLLSVLCFLAVSAGPARASTAAPVPLVPDGYRVVAQRQLSAGVTETTLVRRDPASVVHVAVRRSGSPAELRVMLSNDALAEPEPRLERTSSMCARVKCLVAINGDFYANTGQPVGGVVADDRLLRSPNGKHHQLIQAPDGTLSTGQIEWRGRLVPSDLQQLELDGVNVERQRDGLVLYTSAQGPTTGANPYGAEMLLEVVRPEGPIRIGQTTLVRIAALRSGGDWEIPQNGAILSGHGRSQRALEQLWARVQAGTADAEALLRLDTTPDAEESIGGSPILVRGGKRWFANEDRDLYRLRNPRSMAGWAENGDLLLVTVDGRQPGYSLGMTMTEAADLMIALGATEAINLDGGGSTTFVAGGAVINRPSDRAVRRGRSTVVVSTPRAGDKVIGNVERPVSVAVALVAPGIASPGGSVPASLVVPLGGGRGSSPAVVLNDSDGPDASATLMVLLALAVGVISARRRAAAIPAVSPAR